MQTLTQAVVPRGAAAAAVPRQAEHDDQLITMWLHGRPKTTRRAYERHVERFLALTGKPLAMITVGDVQDFADSMAHLAPRSRNQGPSAVKSLLTYGQRIGYLSFNVGAVVKLEKVGNDLAQRILPEDAVQRMLHTSASPRNRAILRLLYGGGLRVSELVRLKWKDVQERNDGGQVTVFGKGGKTRHVLLSAATWEELVKLRNGGDPDSPVFPSRRGGGRLDPSAAWRIVRKAAARAGIDGNVSPHWLRHAHASHALERGAPVALVRDTLRHSSVSRTNGYLHARPNDRSARYLVV